MWVKNEFPKNLKTNIHYHTRFYILTALKTVVDVRLKFKSFSLIFYNFAKVSVDLIIPG